MSTIKAIAFEQPGASHLLHDSYYSDFRTWWTAYRGPLLVVSTRKFNTKYHESLIKQRQGVSGKHSSTTFENSGSLINSTRERLSAVKYNPDDYPLQHALGIVRLKKTGKALNRIAMGEISPKPKTSKQLYEFSFVEPKVKFITPFPCKGKPMLFDVELPPEYEHYLEAWRKRNKF